MIKSKRDTDEPRTAKLSDIELDAESQTLGFEAYHKCVNDHGVMPDHVAMYKSGYREGYKRALSQPLSATAEPTEAERRHAFRDYMEELDRKSIAELCADTSPPAPAKPSDVGDEELQDLATKKANNYCITNFGEWKYLHSHNYTEGYFDGYREAEKNLTETRTREMASVERVRAIIERYVGLNNHGDEYIDCTDFDRLAKCIASEMQPLAVTGTSEDDRLASFKFDLKQDVIKIYAEHLATLAAENEKLKAEILHMGQYIETTGHGTHFRNQEAADKRIAELEAELVQYHRMAVAGVWVEQDKYLGQIQRINELTEALERIADVTSAHHPGRTTSFTDYELRAIARAALEGKKHEP